MTIEARSRSVIIVEDEDLIAQILKTVLTSEADLGDLNILIASNSPEGKTLAVESAEKGLTPDIIYLDIRLPGGSGLELLRYFKTHPLLKEVPVIMLSADNDSTLKNECLEAGAVDFIPKPFDIDYLIERTRLALAL